MEEILKRDGNHITVLGGITDDSNQYVTMLRVDPVTKRLLISATGSGQGTVTSVSVVTANGFSGTVATATTTPAITLTTSLTAASVPFVGSTSNFTQDNANFFYTSASKTLSLDVAGTNTAIHTGPAAGTSNATVGGSGVEIIGTNNTTGGMNLTVGNKSNGTSAFVDLFLQNDLADATGTHYGVVNLNSSTYTDTSFGTGLAVANQMSIYGTDGPTMVGSFKASTGAVNFIVGGAASTNEVGRFTTTGLTVGLTGTLTGAIKFAGATSTFITLQGQAVGASGVLTLPATTDTVAVLAASQAFTNKTYNGLTVTSTTGTFTLTNAKTLAVTNTLTLSGTDSTVMTFPTTSATIARTDAANTFTGTQTIGALVATTVNGNTFTTGTGILTIAAGKTATHNATTTFAGTDGKTLTISKTLTLDGTDSTTMTFPSTSATIARTDAAQTFTGIQTIPQIVNTPLAATVASNAATITRASRINNFTNSSAATMAITLSTSGALDGDLLLVRVYDFSAVAQTIGWTNTENSTASVPTTSNGSTTLPLTAMFQFNGSTSKWRSAGSF